MEIIQQSKVLVVSAADTVGRGIGSMTCPPPPLIQLSLVWTVALLLCKPDLAVWKQTHNIGSKQGTEIASVWATAESAMRYLQPIRMSEDADHAWSVLQLRCL